MLIIFTLMKDHLGFYVSDIGRLMRKRFDVATRELGVTGSQWRVLFMLQRQPGINQGQIADNLEVEPITTCRMIDRLEQAGLVERRRDPSDRRAWQIFLTQEAEPITKKLNVIADEMLTQSLRGFAASDAAQLRDLLGRLRTNLIEETSGDIDPAERKEALHG